MQIKKFLLVCLVSAKSMNIIEKIKKSPAYKNYGYTKIKKNLRKVFAELGLSDDINVKKQFVAELEETLRACVAQEALTPEQKTNEILEEIIIDSHAFLTHMYLSLHDTKKAKKHCLECTRLLDNCAKIRHYPEDIYLTAAYFHRAAQDYRAALAAADKSIKLQKIPVYSFLLKIDVYDDMKDYTAVVDHCAKLYRILERRADYRLSLESELMCGMQRAHAYFCLEDFNSAQKYYRKLSAILPENAYFSAMVAACTELKRNGKNLKLLTGRIASSEQAKAQINAKINAVLQKPVRTNKAENTASALSKPQEAGFTNERE